MSIKVELSKLSKTEAKQIQKDLNIVKESSFYLKKKQRFGGGGSETIVKFYSVSDDAKHVFLPFTYGRALTKDFPNDDLEYAEAKLTFKGNLRKNQEEVIDEALEHLNKTRTVLLALCTGFGKTVLGAYLSVTIGLRVCVLYHRSNLGVQWEKTFRDNTDGSIWTVGEGAYENQNIILCMGTRVHKIPEEIVSTIGTLIVDEAHCFCTPTAPSIFLKFTPKYIILETATPDRKDGMDQIIYDLIDGESVVHRISEKPFTVFKLMTEIELTIKRDQDGSINWPDLIDKYTKDKERNNILLTITRRFKEKKILFLTERNDHVLALSELMKPEIVATMSGTQTNYNDARILIGNISKLGTGFDQEAACLDFGGVRIDLVVLCVSIKSLSRLEQCVGRGLRSEYPTIIHLVDGIDLIRKSHWRECSKWYKSRKATVYEVSCDDLFIPRLNWEKVGEELLETEIK